MAARGKPLTRPHLEGTLFEECWRSGSSHRNLLTRLGAANHCLWVAVCPEGLTVGPHFPFTLIFLPEIYDVEHRIPSRAIESVRPSSSWPDSADLIIRYRRPDGSTAAFDLSLKDAEAFRRAIKTIAPNATIE